VGRVVAVVALLVWRTASAQAPSRTEPTAPAVPPDAGAAPSESAQPALPTPSAAPPAPPPIATTPEDADVTAPRPIAAPAPATKTDRFPVAMPDRPLVLPAGATELELSYGFVTRVEAVADVMGNVMYERTGFADDYTPELRVSHAFGRFEVGGFIDNEVMRATLDVDTGAIPEVVAIAASFIYYTDGRYSYTQSLAARHQVVLVPGRFAVSGGASVYLNERKATVDAMTREGYVVGGNVGVRATVQLPARFAFQCGPYVGGPFRQSPDFEVQVALGVQGHVFYALRKWDFYIGGALNNITSDFVSTYFTLGFRKRWGL
jgi:hypothetical protein